MIFDKPVLLLGQFTACFLMPRNKREGERRVDPFPSVADKEVPVSEVSMSSQRVVMSSTCCIPAL